MIKVKLVVLVGFLLAFAAGLVAGLARDWYIARRSTATAPLAVTQPASGTPTRPTTRRLSFAQAVGLSGEQDKQVHQMREEAFREAMREVDERRAAIRRQRDDAILAMLSPENRLVYETIMQHYEAAMKQVDREPPKAFERMDERIKGILDPQQRARFEEMLRKRDEDRKRWEPRRRGESPTTRPAGTTIPSQDFR